MNTPFFVTLCEQHNCVMLEPRQDLDACVVGIVSDGVVPRAAYSRDRLLKHFQRINQWDRDEAEDWLAYNVEVPQCAGWPVFVDGEV